MSEAPNPNTPNTKDVEPNAEAGGETSPATLEIDSYLRVWCETLSAVLSQIAGHELALRQTPEAGLEAVATAAPGPGARGPGASGPAEVFFNITLAGALRGEQMLGLTAAQGRWLGAAFMGELPPEVAPGIPAVPGAEPASELTPGLTQEQRETLEELFRQVAGRAASDLKRSWGDVQIHVQSSGAPSWPAAAGAWFTTPVGSTSPVALELRLSAALVATLRRPEAASGSSMSGLSASGSSASESLTSASSTSGAAAAPAPAFSPGSATSTTTASTTGPTTGPATTLGEAPAPGAVNLDFLKNVPLNLTLRFGQRRMALREILELGPGSVIELDRRLKEPVDLLLDGKVLARGEVVVVHGCYGLRVTQIAARGGEEQ